MCTSDKGRKTNKKPPQKKPNKKINPTSVSGLMLRQTQEVQQYNKFTLFS